MEYSLNEKKAVISVVKSMALADKVIDANEDAYIHQLGKLLNLSDKELDGIYAASDSVQTLLALKKLSGMEDEKKAALKQMIKQMMTCDGTITPEEQKLYHFLCTIMGLNNVNGNDTAIDYDPLNVED